MRISQIYSFDTGYHKQNYGIKNNKNFTFGAAAREYGLLSKQAQLSLENLHKNLGQIHDLFLLFAHYPAKAIAIKDGYARLSQKNRNQGLSFILPDNRGSIIIRQLRSNSDLLRLVVEDKGKVTSFLTNGYNKAVANINQNNPQFLPRNFKYMTSEEIKNSGIEEYIRLADEEIDNYNKYLEQFRDPVKLKKLSIAKESKTELTKKVQKQKTASEINIQKLVKIFEYPTKELPENIKPKDNTKDNLAAGFSILLNDGATLKVLKKKADITALDKILYISFEKLTPDGKKSFMSYDLEHKTFLRMKDDGKPLIRNGIIYEYSEEEVKKRNMQEKLENCLNEIFDAFKKPKQERLLNPAANNEKISGNKEILENAGINSGKEINNLEQSKQDSNFEKLKQLTIKKAKEDADILSELYFKTFKENFVANITKKINDFKIEIEKLLT